MAISQVNPASQYPISRVLIDSTDSTLYYPQAKVYDDVTGETLATVDLAFVATRRYMTLYKVPYDNPYGKGRYITIVVSVFTDSAHTTKSDLYYDEVQQLFIAQMWNPSMISVAGTNGPSVGAVPAAAEIDYKKIEEIVRREVKKIEEMEIDMKPVQEGFAEISQKIDNIDIPVPEKADLSSIERGVKSLSSDMKSYHVNQTKQLIPVIDRLQTLGSTIGSLDKQHMEILQDALKRMIDEVITPLQKENARLKSVLANGFPETTEDVQAKKRKMYLDGLMAKYSR